MMQNYLTTNIIANHEFFDKEYRIIRLNDKKERWVHGMGELEFGENGELLKMFGTIQDITKRKKAEQLITIQKKNLRNILEGTNAGTWDWKIDTGELTINDRWAEIIGYTIDELKPITIKTWSDNVHPEDLKKANSKLDKVFSKEISYYDVEFRQPHKNGKWVWVNARGKVIEWDSEDKPIKMSGIHIDITNQKKQELVNDVIYNITR